MADGGCGGEPLGLGDEALEEHIGKGTFESPGLVDALPEASARPLRRLLWARLLGLTTGSDPETWAQQLQAHRDAYAALKERHRLEEDVKSADPTICNPLSRHADNPFVKRKANEELSEEIWKDVERTFPEIDFFHHEASRRCIQQVLYHWCKACNPAADASESYRQGMNELAGLCFYVVRHGEHAGMGGLGSRLCGRAHNEADTHALFGEIMERGGLRDMFAIARAKPAAKAKPAADIGSLPGMAPARRGPTRQPISAVLARCKHIFHTLLKQADARVHAYLGEKGVEPQIFLLRWIRLLFCREFHVADTVMLWTSFFADVESAEAQAAAPVPYAAPDAVDREGVQAAEAASRALPLVDFFAVAMIEFLRQQLLSMDESECLQRLMKFPPVESVATLVTLAKRLRAGERVFTDEPPPLAAPPLAAPDPLAPPRQPAPQLVPANARPSAVVGGSSPAAASGAAPATAVPTQVATGAQDVLRGILSAGRQAVGQAVEGIAAKVAAGDGATQASDIWSGDSGTSAIRIAQLEQKVAALEQEKATIAAKAKQFVAMKTQEFKDKVAELEAKLQAAEGAAVPGDAPDRDISDEAAAATAGDSADGGGASAEVAALRVEVAALQGQALERDSALADARREAAEAAERAAAEATARAAAEAAASAAELKASQLEEELETLRRAVPGSAEAAEPQAGELSDLI